jgi:thiosulfate dehydrogenase (quinone) large subunit
VPGLPEPLRLRDWLTTPTAARAAVTSRELTLVGVAFGVVWAIDAVLKWRPSFVLGFQDQVSAAASRQPSWLSGWFSFWSDLTGARRTRSVRDCPRGTVIAVGVITGLRHRLLYLISFVWSLAIWAIPEGFGGPCSSDSTYIGTAIIYPLVFAAHAADHAYLRRAGERAHTG